MTNWLGETIEEVHSNQQTLEKKKQLVSAISLLVAYKKLKKKYFITTLLVKHFYMILNMASLSSTGFCEEYSYLRMQIKTTECWYV